MLTQPMPSVWNLLDLDELSEQIWKTLTEAVDQPTHPWRFPAVATSSRKGPKVRVMVLRGVTRPGFELLAFSDSRTGKIAELQAKPVAAWLFYDPQERVQVRAETEVRLHGDDAVADTFWHRLPAHHRHNYQTELPPGASIEQPGAGHVLSPGSVQRFAVIIARVTRVDWLWLAESGHRRAIFDRETSGWRGRWVVP